ncbi:MAG: nuclear transport factor 2 family protein [Ekhidna sp.]
MKIISFLSIIVILSGCSNSSSQSVISDDDSKAVENILKVLSPKAYNEQDTALLNQILHEKFQLVDDEGSRFSKSDEMEYASKYGPSYDSYEYDVKSLDLYDNGTALVSGEGTIKGINVAGQAYVTTYKTSDVLIKEDGNWRMINSHVSGVKEEVYENAPEE